MRLIKLFGLTGVAAVAAMAFIGASSASATVLCETTPTTSGSKALCHTGWDVAANSITKWTSTHFIITTNITNITCTHAELELKNTNTGDDGVDVHMDVLGDTLSGCKMTSFPFSNCSVSTKNLPYTGFIRRIPGTHGGVFRELKGSGGPPSRQFLCAGFINCTFGAPAGLELEVRGGNPATILANEQELTKETGGILCPSLATFHATYSAVGTTSALWFGDDMD